MVGVASTRLVEIGLATVLLGVPSSVLSGAMGPYDEPKAWAVTILIGLTAIAALAARARGTSPLPRPAPDRAARIAGWCVVAYAAWSAVATVLSVAPSQSLWGAFGRGFGLATVLAAVLVFWIVQGEFRSVDRACRLVDFALLGSVPVVVLGLGQALGWDPLPPGWDPATYDIRVRSTFGQHIFLGSYLVVLISLGIGRAMVARRQSSPIPVTTAALGGLWALGVLGLLGWAGHGATIWFASLAWTGAFAAISIRMSNNATRGITLPPRWTAIAVSGLVAVQVLVLVLSTARGALIGLLAGIGAAVAVALASRRAWRTLVVAGSGLLAIVIVVGALNFGWASLSGLKEITVFQRLGSITRLHPGSPGWVRVRLWGGIVSRWPRQFLGDQVVPGLPPWVRGLVGFGPESQLLVLDQFLPPELRTIQTGQLYWQARYSFDRAHDEVLDHLVMSGAIGMLIWLAVVVSVIGIGFARLRASRGMVEEGLRLGCLAALVGQTVEGLVGIATPMPRVLFWMAAGIATLPSPLPLATQAESRPRTPAAIPGRLPVPSIALVAGTVLLFTVAVAGHARWALGSLTYAAGVQRAMAQDFLGAREDFLRASHLAPSSPYPAEAAADLSLRATVLEAEIARHADWLREASDVLDRARRHVPVRSELWRLGAQVAIARARTGEIAQLDEALRDFAEADRLRPGDPEILTQWAVATLRSGNVSEAKRLAEQALTSGRRAWLAWAVLANVYDRLGDKTKSLWSAQEARRTAPRAAREHVEQLLPPP